MSSSIPEWFSGYPVGQVDSKWKQPVLTTENEFKLNILFFCHSKSLTLELLDGLIYKLAFDE